MIKSVIECTQVNTEEKINPEQKIKFIKFYQEIILAADDIEN